MLYVILLLVFAISSSVYAKTVRVTAYCRYNSVAGGPGGGGNQVWGQQDVVLSTTDYKTTYCLSSDIVGGYDAFVVPCASGTQYYEFTYNSCKAIKSGSAPFNIHTKGGSGTSDIGSCEVEQNGHTVKGKIQSDTNVIPVGINLSGACVADIEVNDGVV